MKAYMSNYAVQTSLDQYNAFIKDVEQVQRIYPGYDEATRERVRTIIEQQKRNQSSRFN